MTIFSFLFLCRFEPGEQYRRTDTVDGQAIRRLDAEIRFGRRRRRRTGRLSTTRPPAFVVGHYGRAIAVAPPPTDGITATAAATRTAKELCGNGRRQLSGKFWSRFGLRFEPRSGPRFGLRYLGCPRPD